MTYTPQKTKMRGDRTFADVGTLTPNTRAEQVAATAVVLDYAERRDVDPRELLRVLFGGAA